MNLTTEENLPEKQIIEGLAKCPNCHSPVFEGDEKCLYCGKYLNKPGFAIIKVEQERFDYEYTPPEAIVLFIPLLILFFTMIVIDLLCR